jgi:(1->4)-alpha-D-glucan 1-alpha-D-glucosylmutase
MQPGSLLRSDAQRNEYVARLKDYALKAAREAKLETSWTAPDDAYESGLERFIERVFEPAHNHFTDSLLRFLPPILRFGAFNSLSQLILKATAPGVPDFYQGNEFWDLSLVDPDNRRPVNYATRREALRSLDFASATTHWREGWLKLWLTERLLALRNRLPGLFASGTYEPLTVTGAGAEHVIAFRRESGDQAVIVVIARLLSQIVRGEFGAFWPGGGAFGDTIIRTDGIWIDHFTGTRIRSEAHSILASTALERLPVAVLSAE